MTTDPTSVDVYPWAPARTNPHTDGADTDAERLKDHSPKRLTTKSGKVLVVYTIGDLAAMLGRSPVTLRKWETQGIFPVTPFKIKGADERGGRRYYTEGMVLGTVAIAREEGVLEMYGAHIQRTNFTPKVVALFEAELAKINAAPARLQVA